MGLLIAVAIVIDNFAEALSVGELILAEHGSGRQHRVRRVIKWTRLIGISLLGSALAGWLLLRNMSPTVLGFLLGAGAGGMFYLTTTDLLPKWRSVIFSNRPVSPLAPASCSFLC